MSGQSCVNLPSKVENINQFREFLETHELSSYISTNGGTSKNLKNFKAHGGTPQPKTCIKHIDNVNANDTTVVDILPIEIWSAISKSDILNAKDLLMFSLTSKILLGLGVSPEKFEIAKYGLAECLMNLAQKLLVKSSASYQNFHYQYGIKLRPSANSGASNRNVFYILVSKLSGDDNVEITFDTATISNDNPGISNNELSSVAVNKNDDTKKIMCSINKFINKTGINSSNIEYIGLKPYSQPGQNIIPSPHGALWYKPIDNKLKLVIRQMRSICTDEKEIHDLFEKMTLSRQQGGNTSAKKILYKGYYYKLRTEGKRTFIRTKHEGEVSLSIIKKRTNLTRMARNGLS